MHIIINMTRELALLRCRKSSISCCADSGINSKIEIEISIQDAADNSKTQLLFQNTVIEKL